MNLVLRMGFVFTILGTWSKVKGMEWDTGGHRVQGYCCLFIVMGLGIS